ncbi:MAG TPA: SMI1/KNR4 family protein [Kofleriaceae bacterium]|nr:SMI1/KNR4 family protein [Kofleriaceae bacterium]
MESRGPRVDEALVSAFEHRHGITLPDDYRRFLLEVNGGGLADENTWVSHLFINGLLSLAEKEHPSLDLETCAEWARHVLPHPDLLLIGYTDSGMLLLAHTGPHRGEVWTQDTVDPRPEGSNPRVLWHDRRDLKKLANSFEELTRKLEPQQTSATHA